MIAHLNELSLSKMVETSGMPSAGGKLHHWLFQKHGTNPITLTLPHNDVTGEKWLKYPTNVHHCLQACACVVCAELVFLIFR